MVFLIESIVGCILFTIPLIIVSRNPLAAIHDYPPAIIQRVKEMGLIDDTQVPRSKKVIMKKSLAALIIAFLCALAVWHFNGARSFLQGAGITYGLWTVVNWYDAISLTVYGSVTVNVSAFLAQKIWRRTIWIMGSTFGAV